MWTKFPACVGNHVFSKLVSKFQVVWVLRCNREDLHKGELCNAWGLMVANSGHMRGKVKGGVLRADSAEWPKGTDRFQWTFTIDTKTGTQISTVLVTLSVCGQITLFLPSAYLPKFLISFEEMYQPGTSLLLNLSIRSVCPPLVHKLEVNPWSGMLHVLTLCLHCWYR
jgi:hypothetical protein